ncbi:MAG: extracellular solute-binding protein [Gaiellaceae bacterium]
MARFPAFLSRSRLAAVSALAVLIACAAYGAATSAAASKTTRATSIRVVDYYAFEPDKTIVGGVLNACGKSVGVKIKRDAIPGANLIQKVLQMASSRTLPDVLMLDNPDLQQFAQSGALTPLGNYGISAKGYQKGVVAASTYKRKLYGLQPITNSIALFYNKDILAKAGVTPPKTWAELRADAKKLTSGNTYGLALSAPANYEGTWQFMPFMWSNGGDERNIATPQVAAALQLLVDLKSDGSMSPSVVTWSQGDVNDQFKAGNAAMMVNGPWQFPVLNSITSLHYGVVPIPVPRAGGVPVAPLGGETWTVPNTGKTAQEQLAAKVVQCLNSDKNQLLLGKKRQVVPTKLALLPQFVRANPALKAFSTVVKTARARTGELGANWPKAATKIYTAEQCALTGQGTPEKCLAQAQNG